MLPKSVTSAEKTTATETGIRSFSPKDVGDMAGGVPVYVRAARTTSLSLPSPATPYPFTETDEKSDAAKLDHDNVTNNERITFKEAGVYVVEVGFPWISDTVDLEAKIECFLRKNGTTQLTDTQESRNHHAASDKRTWSFVAIATVHSFAADDYVEFITDETVNDAKGEQGAYMLAYKGV